MKNKEARIEKVESGYIVYLNFGTYNVPPGSLAMITAPDDRMIVTKNLTEAIAFAKDRGLVLWDRHQLFELSRE